MPKLKRTPSQNGKLSRNKGAAEERRICLLYSAILGKKVQRDISQYQESSGRDLRGCEPLVIQVKHGKQPNTIAALKEAIAAVSGNYTLPIAHVHKDREVPMVILRESDWLEIIEVFYDGTQRSNQVPSKNKEK